MDINKLFTGIAVIADNQIDEADSNMSIIKKSLEENNIPVLTFRTIPKIDLIDSLSSSSMVILDWDFSDAVIMPEAEERVRLGNTARDDLENELIEFIQQLLEKSTSSVFIFTAKDIDGVDGVIGQLKEHNLYFEDKPNRIFIKSKGEIQSKTDLFRVLEEWLKNNPSAYVLKELDYKIKTTKTKMFSDLYSSSPYWPCVILKTLYDDNKSEYTQDFGKFLIKNLANRMEDFSLDIPDNLPREACVEEIERIMESERYIQYRDEKPSIPHTGDLFKEQSEGVVKYYLSIRAQCDLIPRNTVADPMVYLITGEEITEVNKGQIKILEQCVLKIGEEKYHLDWGKENLQSINAALAKNRENVSINKDWSIQIGEQNYQLNALIDSDDRKKINDAIRSRNGKPSISNGEVISKETECIIPCIDGKAALKFTFDLSMRPYSEIKDMVVGRLLPPYITRIQQKFSKHIIREGILRTPEIVFDRV